MAETSNKQKVFNIVLIILLIVSIILGTVGIIKASQAKNNLPPGYPPPDKPGLGDALGDIVNNIFNLFGGKKCDPNNNCYQKNGTYNLQCCKTADGGWSPSDVNCVNGCDQNKKGYDCNGFPNIDCGFGRVAQ